MSLLPERDSGTTESPKTRVRLLAVVLSAIALALLAAGCSTVVEVTASEAQQQQSAAAVVSGVPGSQQVGLGPTADELNTIAVIERSSPSTAALSVVVGGEPMLPPTLDGEAVPDGPLRRSSGSGFVVEFEGTPFVVSNFHVVEATLESGTSQMRSDATISAAFPGIDSEVPLRVIGVNPSFDLALLEAAFEEEPLPPVAPLPIADSDLVRKGQKTLAIGNPFSLGNSVSTGIVSSVDRFVTSIGEVPVPMIQTDAAVNPGNSGGAFLNSSGEVIGVNTAIFNPEARAFAGIGFAVPSNLLQESLSNLEFGGVSTFSDTRPSFGARLGTLSLLPAGIRDQAALPDDGIAVLGVAPGGPAEAAGLRAPEFTDVQGVPVPIDPDIIVAIDGMSISNAETLNQIISYGSDFGEEVELTILRDGQEQILPVMLGDR